MEMKRIFYLKANRKEWNDKFNEKNKNLDWTLIKNRPTYEGGVLYSARHKKRDYFELVKPGDLVILHSTHIHSSRKNKEGTIDRQEFIPKPRIVGISKIKKRLYYDDRYKDYVINIDVKNMILFNKHIEIRELDIIHNNLLKNAEPFKVGSNRFGLTELKKEEYEIIMDKIINKNPELKNKIKQLEQG